MVAFYAATNGRTPRRERKELVARFAPDAGLPTSLPPDLCLAALAAFVERQTAARGTIRITKDPAMFVAR